MMKVADRNLRHTLFILLGTLLLMYILSIPAYAESTTAVRCIDADGKDMGTQDCLPVAQTMTEGWYVSSDATFNDRIQVTGNVNLILKDNTLLKASAGIEVPPGSELTIWAQSTGENMGKLEAVRKDGLGSDETAGIGCNSKGEAGNITINGGEIRANGSNWEQEVDLKPGGPGISGEEVTINGGVITAIGKGRTSNSISGAGINGKTIIINGGTVDATGGYYGGAGIGSNYHCTSADVTINGGTVTATGGYCSGSGIGGGGDGASFSGNVKITGGTVTAKGMNSGPGIGGSGAPLVGTITISGGDVTAIGGDTEKYSGAGIGGVGFNGTIKISGGTVRATGGEYSAGIGASLASNAKDGHIIIEGGTVIAKGGEGAAGIGGGAENAFGTGGEGCDDVQIKGGTVFAQSGTGSCSAIGHGDDDEHMGKITFANGMCVKADTRTDGDMNGAYERNGKPFLWQGKDSVDGRMSACQYRHTALITECEHAATPGENDGIIHVDSTTHLRSVCAYCKRPSVGEPHTYDDSGKCTVCGYKQTICTVTFADGQGNTLKTETVRKGKAATAPDEPSREGYTFNGWDTDFSNVTSDLTVTAKWKQNLVTYQVTFEDGFGKVLDTQTVVSGRPATAPEEPTREGYLFSGWDKDFSNVTSNLTVKAVWTAESQDEDTYTVVFVLGFGNEPVTQTVEKDGSATEPTIPTVDGFTFTGWDKEFTNITDNLTVTAQWKKNTAEEEYTVTFVNGYPEATGPIATIRVKYGQAADPPADPTRDGYTFEGWDTDFSYVTENITVIAQWKQNAPTPAESFTVTFVDGQGTTLKTETVEKGKGATAPEDPTREGYTFDGWDKDFSNVTSDLTVTAKWKESATPTPSKPVSIANAKVVLSASSFAYNGKVRKPSIKTIGGKALKSGTDYTVKWSNTSSKNVGSYTVTITGKGNYIGTTKATYKINPKGTSLKKPKKAKKAITAKWKKQAAKMSKSRITGYQIQLATDKQFTKNKKTVTVKGYKKVSKKVKKLKAKKKYYIRIRTYKTVSGKKYYSGWSKVKAIKTK